MVDYRGLPGSPTYQEKRNEDLSLLEWTWEIVGKNATQNEKNAFYLCDYYRLVRNHIVHSSGSDNHLRQRYSIVEKLGGSKLEAPNIISQLTFDDQVLFSRAAFFIFTEGKYDITEVVESLKTKLYPQINTFLGKDGRAIAKRKIQKTLEAYYPPFENADWDAVLYTIANVRGASE